MGVQVHGKGSAVIGENSYLKNCSFFFQGPNNNIIIGANVRLIGVEFIMRYGGNNSIIVGSQTTTGGTVQIEASEGTTIIIGEDCMFSHNIKLFSTDSHSIVDENGQRINFAKDITIGNHVWIGMNSIILKGSFVPNNSIISANSVYTMKKFDDANSIFAGVPARKIKNKINWKRKLIWSQKMM